MTSPISEDLEDQGWMPGRVKVARCKLDMRMQAWASAADLRTRRMPDS